MVDVGMGVVVAPHATRVDAKSNVEIHIFGYIQVLFKSNLMSSQMK